MALPVQEAGIRREICHQPSFGLQEGLLLAQKVAELGLRGLVRYRFWLREHTVFDGVVGRRCRFEQNPVVFLLERDEFVKLCLVSGLCLRRLYPLFIDLHGHLREPLLLGEKRRLRGLRHLNQSWVRGFELLLLLQRKLGEDFLEEFCHERHVVVARLFLGVLLVGRILASAFCTVRVSLHQPPIEDPSAAELRRALGPAAVRTGLLDSRHVFATTFLATGK